LSETSNTTKFVGPGREAAQPTKLIELGQHLHQRVVRGLLGQILEFRAGDRTELTAPSRQLMDCHPKQYVVKPRHGLVVSSPAHPEAVDPSLRLRVERRPAAHRPDASCWAVADMPFE
jgi:hypothetical protein